MRVKPAQRKRGGVKQRLHHTRESRCRSRYRGSILRASHHGIRIALRVGVRPIFRSISLALPLLTSIACSGSTGRVIDAHEVTATLDYDGARYSATLAFSEYDTAAMADGNDWREISAAVSGQSPIEHANLKASSPDSRTYDLSIRRNAADEAAYIALGKEKGADPNFAMPFASCRVYGSSFGMAEPCSFTTRPCTMTLTMK